MGPAGPGLETKGLLQLPAGLFITAAYLSSSWTSARSRRAFDVPPPMPLNEDVTVSVCVCVCVCVSVCLGV